MAKEDIRQYSRDELRKLNAEGKFTKTRPDAPEYELDEAFWDNAKIIFPGVDPSVTDNRSIGARFHRHYAGSLSFVVASLFF